MNMANLIFLNCIGHGICRFYSRILLLFLFWITVNKTNGWCRKMILERLKANVDVCAVKMNLDGNEQNETHMIFLNDGNEYLF